MRKGGKEVREEEMEREKTTLASSFTCSVGNALKASLWLEASRPLSAELVNTVL